MIRPSSSRRLPGRRSVSYLIAVGAVGIVGAAPLLSAAPALADTGSVNITVQAGQIAHVELPGSGDYGIYGWPDCGVASWLGTAYTFDASGCSPQTTGQHMVDYADGSDIFVNITVTAATTPPAAPSSVEVTPGDGSLTLNWSAVADADAYEYSLDGGTTWSSDISSTSTTVSSLVNGTSYSVVVRALTLGVPGSASGPVTAAPLALPSTPATPLVAPGIGQLTISWAAADSAEQVDSYEYTTDGGLTWTPGTSGTTVSGLVFGIVYQVGVRSHNATGYSPASAYTPSLTLFPFVLPPPINPIPSLALPSAPATPTISVNSTTSALTITWAAANSAEQVDGYEYSTDGGITWTAGTSPTTISGLAAGVYTVVVRAHNATGYGPASTYAPALISSAPTPPIPPTPPTPPSTPTVTPPAAPSRPVVTSGQRSISISWPAVTAATSYEYSLNGGQSWSQPTTHRSVTVTGLQDGRTYSVKVRALTGSVTGAASAAVSVTTTPAAKPQPQPAVPSVQQRGSRGADVVRIQQLLGIAADGIFGPQTAAAVRGFQAAHHLQVDGIVGRQTWTALLGGSATTTTTASNRPWLQLGSTGNSVREAQQRLGGLAVDGIFGARTRSAVMAFQAKHHLQVDGIVGTQTWAALLAR